MMVTFAIGNSDDKLPQTSWSAFVTSVHLIVDKAVEQGAQIRFAGHSPPGSPWQNALWAVEIGYPLDGAKRVEVRAQLRAGLAVLAGRWRQDAIAWWDTAAAEMIRPAARQAGS
jgi:hypothetical protein